jgi:predicted lipoprotein with Yx(FWY)xxD motif
MNKKLQHGFAALETVLVLVIVGLVAFVVWYAFHTKSNTDTTYGNAANTQTEVSKENSNKTNTNTQSTASQVVVTKTDSKGSQYLADGNDKTLYTYGADTSGVSNCTGACLAAWPIYKATSATSLPANVSIITRSDGGTQYAYKGMPLYYYTGDIAAGQTTGDGVNNFSLAKP